MRFPYPGSAFFGEVGRPKNLTSDTHSMADSLFLYGTLLPGLAPAAIAGAAAQLRFAGEGSVRGRLYDLGEFPGAILDSSADHRIFGAVFSLPEDPAVLLALDEYEEFIAALPQASQFVRMRTAVTLTAGGTLDCWIYVYNRRITTERVIASGRWKPTGCAGGGIVQGT